MTSEEYLKTVCTASVAGAAAGLTAYGVEKIVGSVANTAVKVVEETITSETEIAADSVLSSEEAEELAFNAIHGPDNADCIVLGKYDDGGPTAYTSIAEEMDAQYFQLDNWDELANQYSQDEIWKINEKFLDIQTSSGREIYLSHNPKKYIDKRGFYPRELKYLQENGYKFIKEGDIWHAVR